jgi:hypothetical protein
MTKLLERAFAVASQLPEDAQDGLAQRFLDEINDQKRWNELFADARSPRLLEQLAREAMGEVERGETVDLDEFLDTNEVQNH